MESFYGATRNRSARRAVSNSATTAAAGNPRLQFGASSRRLTEWARPGPAIAIPLYFGGGCFAFVFCSCLWVFCFWLFSLSFLPPLSPMTSSFFVGSRRTSESATPTKGIVTAQVDGVHSHRGFPGANGSQVGSIRDGDEPQRTQRLWGGRRWAWRVGSVSSRIDDAGGATPCPVSWDGRLIRPEGGFTVLAGSRTSQGCDQNAREQSR